MIKNFCYNNIKKCKVFIQLILKVGFFLDIIKIL